MPSYEKIMTKLEELLIEVAFMHELGRQEQLREVIQLIEERVSFCPLPKDQCESCFESLVILDQLKTPKGE